jgi:hypothetical protein
MAQAFLFKITVHCGCYLTEVINFSQNVGATERFVMLQWIATERMTGVQISVGHFPRSSSRSGSEWLGLHQVSFYPWCSVCTQSPPSMVLGLHPVSSYPRLSECKLRVDVWTHVFLTSALVEGEWWDSRPGRFTPGERIPFTDWVGGCVSPRAGLDDLEKWKFLPPPWLGLLPLVPPARRQ